jgi:hypothetical protein
MTHRGTTILDLEARAEHAMQIAVNSLLELSERSQREAEVCQLCGEEGAAAEYVKKAQGLKELADRLAKKGGAA